MSDTKDSLRSGLKFEHFVRSAATIAILGAACLLPTTVGAQTMTPNVQSTIPASVEPMTVDQSQVGPAIDYKILANPYFNYGEIYRAKAHGLSDDEIGRAIEIAERSRTPVDQVIGYIGDGWSFVSIEGFLGAPNVLGDEDYGLKVRNYLAAYRATGEGALRAKDEYQSSPNSTGTLNGGMPSYSAMTVQSGNILQVLSDNGNFTEFLKLARRARLDRTLTSDGPYTVFAPTDSAFAKLSSDQVKHLWHDRSELRRVLEYHIIPAKIDSSDAMAMTSPTSPATLEGDSLQVTTSNGNVMINGAMVTMANIQASNGIIHAVDTVLMPSTDDTVGSQNTGTYGTATPSLNPGYNVGGSTSTTSPNVNGTNGSTTTTPNGNGTGSTSISPNTTSPGTGSTDMTAPSNGTGMTTSPGTTNSTTPGMGTGTSTGTGSMTGTGSSAGSSSAGASSTGGSSAAP